MNQYCKMKTTIFMLDILVRKTGYLRWLPKQHGSGAVSVTREVWGQWAPGVDHRGP